MLLCVTWRSPFHVYQVKQSQHLLPFICGLYVQERRVLWSWDADGTCFPPPLLGWMLEEMVGPDGPPLLLFPVQLLHRISPWFPFFHIDEEFVLQTEQSGFRPSGIVDGQNTSYAAPKCRSKSWTIRWRVSARLVLKLLLYDSTNTPSQPDKQRQTTG